MKGCKYCCVNENGECTSDLKELISYKKRYTTKNRAVKIYDEGISGEMGIEISVNRNMLSYFEDGELRAERIIKYCPMCGRQLQVD